MSREPSTVDLARRLGFIKPDHVIVPEAPREGPVAVFNPAMEVAMGRVMLYPRIVTGYYRYVSAIGRVEFDLASVLDGLRLERRSLRIQLEITPGSWADFWGAEDPRLTKVGGTRVLTYAGRTAAFFTGEGPRVVPVVAVEGGDGWERVGYVLTSRAEFDKDAFIVEWEGSLYLFHRPSIGGRPVLAVTPIKEIPRGILRVDRVEPVMEPEKWESKLGWAAPPIPAGGGLLALVHAMDRDPGVYRVFAVILKRDGGGLRVAEYTKTYIMEPREPLERFGDRPYVVFPTGAAPVDGALLVAYGAADTATGLALVPGDEVMALMVPAD